MSVEILKFPTAAEAAVACGDRILELLAAARAARGVARLAVSGGSSPRVMFQSMASRGFDWSGIEWFQVDERMVPPGDAQSNFRMTREAILDSVPSIRFHRMEGERDPAEAAKNYVADITRTFGLQPGELPVFDVIHRGMGPDMHTASLFPGEPLIANETDIAAAVWVPKMNQHRVTLLPGVLRRARRTLTLATGADKVEALRSVLHDPTATALRPAQICSDEMSWYVDNAAATSL